MEKIRHDSSYEWLSGESWKEWSASFFSMGWKIWGVVLITELFLFLFFKPTADCGRLRYGWLFIVRPSGLQLLLLFVYRLLTGRQKRVYSRRAMAGCAIFLLTSYAAVMAWVHTSVTLMPMVLLLPMLLTPLYKDRVMTLVQAALLVAAYVLDCVYFIPASSYFPLTTPFIEGSIFVGTVCGMLVALELVNDSAIVNDERSKRDSLTKLYNHESFYEELEYYQRRYEENRERFSLAVIDIDNFKNVNQSYLQALFKILGLPFLPAYTDASFKIKTRFDSHNELTLLGLGGIDRMKLNLGVEGEDAEYMLSYLPEINQETYTVGGVYRHYSQRHVQAIVLSQSYLNNRNVKYRDNDESSEENLTLRLGSIEQETKLRMENTSSWSVWKVKAGFDLNYSRYKSNEYRKVFANALREYDYHTDLSLWRWGMFASVDYAAPDKSFTASMGVRTDGNNYSDKMKELWRQLSPRLSVSYRLIEGLTLSGHVGLYYQLPSYTALGFKGEEGEYVNRHLDYISVSQESLGLSWTPNENMELSVEGFYKLYGHMPFSLSDQIPLSCKGNDYGTIGNEALSSEAKGRSYGVELMFKWLLTQKLNLSSSLTIFKSEFKDGEQGSYVPSAWDNRFILNMSGTYNFPKHWSLGAKVSCIGGSPYTPYDVEKSSLVEAWNVQGRAYYDYSRYNQERLPVFGQLDVRVDKTFYLKKCMLGFYLDIQNITASKLRQPDALMSTGQIENPSAPLSEQRYVMKSIRQESGTLLPTLGITFEY